MKYKAGCTAILARHGGGGGAGAGLGAGVERLGSGAFDGLEVLLASGHWGCRWPGRWRRLDRGHVWVRCRGYIGAHLGEGGRVVGVEKPRRVEGDQVAGLGARRGKSNVRCAR